MKTNVLKNKKLYKKKPNIKLLKKIGKIQRLGNQNSLKRRYHTGQKQTRTAYEDRCPPPFRAFLVCWLTCMTSQVSTLLPSAPTACL